MTDRNGFAAEKNGAKSMVWRRVQVAFENTHDYGQRSAKIAVQISSVLHVLLTRLD